MNINMHLQLQRVYMNRLFVILLVGCLISRFSLADDLSAKNKNPFPVKYISLEDQKLNIRTKHMMRI